jgi:hypothetical protein
LSQKNFALRAKSFPGTERHWETFFMKQKAIFGWPRRRWRANWVFASVRVAGRQSLSRRIGMAVSIVRPAATFLTSEPLDLRRDFGEGPTARRAKTGGKGIRTPDFQLAKLALYQLSYAPKEIEDCRWKMEDCNDHAVVPPLRDEGGFLPSCERARGE